MAPYLSLALQYVPRIRSAYIVQKKYAGIRSIVCAFTEGGAHEKNPIGIDDAYGIPIELDIVLQHIQNNYLDNLSCNEILNGSLPI